MKFSDGAWLMRKGVKAYYASESRSIEIEDNQVTIYAPCQRVRHRGDTLTGPLFTIAFSSPAKDVIKMKIIHFKKNQKLPKFHLNEQKLSLKVNETDEYIDINASKTKVRIFKKEWKIEYYYANKLLTYSGVKGLGMMEVNETDKYMCEHLNLSVGEKIYGLGERFTHFIKNGQCVDIWNKDGGTGTEQSYKNIPFYISSKGYGLLVNEPGKVSFEIGSEKVSKVQFSTAGNELEYIIFPGNTPKEILGKYGFLAGLPSLPPAWSFGLWLTTSFTTDYDEKTVTSFIDGMEQRDLPLHIFHFDCFWMKEYEWCNFTWDENVFPDPEGMIKRLKKKGLHICVWINPYIAQKSPLYDEGLKNGYFVQHPDKNPWQWDLWQPGMAIVDFTNSNACRWYERQLEMLLDIGVDCFKTDFGERIPVDNVVYYDGSDPEKMHNYYSYLYNKVVFEFLERKLGKVKAILFARSGTVGSQQFPVHWGGDCTAEYESMAESLRGGLSLCLSGFGFWSHDIGGFESKSTADIYKRWIAFGLLSSHSRLHGSSSYRVPWCYDEESVDVLRRFTKLKCRLMPYLFSQACETAKTGVPLMRAMFLEHPDDLVCQMLDMQYYLGDSLVVAPIFNEDGRCDYYLPSGQYTHLLSNEIKEGGRYYCEYFDYFGLPLYVAPNTIIPMGAVDTRPSYDYLDDVCYHIFNVENNVTKELPVYNIDNQMEETITLTRKNSEVIIKRLSNKKASIVMRNICSIVGANVPYSESDLGIKLECENATREVIIQLES